MLTFSQALDEAKQGAQIHRAGWNGGHQVVFVVKPPQSAAPNEPKYEVNLDDKYVSIDGLSPFLMLRNTQGICCPWVPSTGDLFADDWYTL